MISEKCVICNGELTDINPDSLCNKCDNKYGDIHDYTPTKVKTPRKRKQKLLSEREKEKRKREQVTRMNARD